jgi:hypothetical protein
MDKPATELSGVKNEAYIHKSSLKLVHQINNQINIDLIK